MFRPEDCVDYGYGFRVMPSQGEIRAKMKKELEEFQQTHGEEWTKILMVDVMKTSDHGLPCFEEVLIQARDFNVQTHIDPSGEIAKEWKAAYDALNASFWHKYISEIPMSVLNKMVQSSGGVDIPVNIVELMKLHPNADPLYRNSLRMADSSLFSKSDEVAPLPDEEAYCKAFEGVELVGVERYYKVDRDVYWKCHFDKRGVLMSMTNTLGQIFTRERAGKYGDKWEENCPVLSIPCDPEVYDDISPGQADLLLLHMPKHRTDGVVLTAAMYDNQMPGEHFPALMPNYLAWKVRSK